MIFGPVRFKRLTMLSVTEQFNRLDISGYCHSNRVQLVSGGYVVAGRTPSPDAMVGDKS